MSIGGIDLTAILVAILGGGFVTGLVALLRFRVDKDAVVVSAAQGAVVVQSGVIDALQDELARARSDRDQERDRAIALEAKVEELRNELRRVQTRQK
jgi:anaerobic glycerol-3-phosphate dehydrogenase